MIRKYIGPPGTGKTHALMSEMLSSGVSWDRILFTSFTKASVSEAIYRARSAGARKDDLYYFRTMHAMSFRLLGLSQDHLAEAKYDDFSERTGYRFKKAGLSTAVSAIPGTDDFLLEGYNKARNLRLPHMTYAERTSALRPYIAEFAKFVERYEAWKDDTDRFDFIDMIERSIAQESCPDVDLAIFDEFQDFSPLLAEQARLWTKKAKMSIVAGDHNQAIYEFLGTDPTIFKSFPADETITLRKSWRVPERIVKKALGVINRNAGEEMFTFDANGAEGVVLEFYGVERIAEGIKKRWSDGHREKYFILGRDNWNLGEARKVLMAHRVPCGGSEAKRALVNTFTSKPSVYTADQVSLLVGDLVPAKQAWEHGAKAKVQNMLDSGFPPVPIAGLVDLGAKPALMEALTTGKVPSFVKMDLAEIAYYESVNRDWEGRMDVAECLTIHGSKGREADVVFIITSITGKTRKGELGGDIEAERRIWYVAITRARKAVVLVEDRGNAVRTTIV